MRKLFTIFFCTFLLSANLFSLHNPPKREMRGVWIATVANIDWPSRQGLSVERQKAEMIRILDEFYRNNINTVVFQIRPNADALFDSPHEPWSAWLTGQQGRAPEPFFDPLQFVIDEARKRFMTVHVWLNPYRVNRANLVARMHPDHLFFRQPELFVRYGNQYYFNPGLDETRAFLNKIVRDIVERYDIDAIHLDDYFYPYPLRGHTFDDQATFEQFPRGFESHQKHEWRRNNVNMIIAELQETIKSVKPWVEFGISPFGIWRNRSSDPRGSDTRGGIENYDDLFADILKWLREGSIDYVVPQLYWNIGYDRACYATLVRWWAENAYGQNLYIGLGVYKMGDRNQPKAWNTGNEIVRQLEYNAKIPGVDGVMFFNTSHFLSNRFGLNDSLQTNFFRYPALVPINRNIAGLPAKTPQHFNIVQDEHNSILFWERIEQPVGYELAFYIVYAFAGSEVGDLNNPANILMRTHSNFVNLSEFNLQGEYTFVVTSVNRFWHESEPAESITRIITN